jgi:anti-sigma regulatory factor (Ser/Thr protein kinase)
VSSSEESTDTRGERGVEAPIELRLELPAVHSAARMARHLVRPFARTAGVRGKELDQLVLIVDELLSNAVDHGGGASALDLADQTDPIRMSLVLSIVGGVWTVGVSDQGGGDADEVDSLLHPEGFPDLEDERGRGFYLMAQMVDRMQVRASEDGLGLTLTATREFTREQPS